MKCTECGLDFLPENDDEEICSDCQLEGHPERDRLLTAQEESERLHRENDPHCIGDDEACSPCVDDDDSDLYRRYGEDDCDEPSGSCEWCGTNLYPEEDYDGLCSQCAWHADLSEGSPDAGGSGIMPIG